MDDPTIHPQLVPGVAGLAEQPGPAKSARTRPGTPTRSCFVYSGKRRERLIVALNFTDKIQVIDSGAEGRGRGDLPRIWTAPAR
ncbi:MAG: hypothetical protein R2838_00055 [Caldilineaceae bacterium]